MNDLKVNGEYYFSKNYNDVILKTAPVGSIIAWAKNITSNLELPDTWVECNGQTINDPDSPYNGRTIPNLNGENRFLRGNTTSGGTGGAEEHTHPTQNVDVAQYYQGGTYHPVLSVDSAGNLPPYYDVVWIMRIK